MRLLLVVAAVILSSAGPALAGAKKLPSRNVQCGDVITESARITNSLADCPGVGLVVGAPGITIDLGGHRIDGVDAEFGIDNTAGHANVTIRNGIVSDFGFGVRILNAEGNTLTDLRITSNGDGIVLEGATGAEIRGNGVRGNGNGIYLESGANDNVIAKNDVSENMFGGIYLEQSTRNAFVGNTVSANGGYGFEVFNASGNSFRGNEVNANGSNGVTLDAGASDNVLRGNRAAGNRADGFEVFGGTGNVLQKNTAQENAEHGIVSDTSALTLRGNRANGNGFANGAGDGAGLGIFVPEGAVQSGNKAAGNDDPRECLSSQLSCHVP